MTLGDHEFTFVASLIPERDASGAILEFPPRGRSATMDPALLHEHGHGPFCEFRIDAENGLGGVYALVVNGVVHYIGQTKNLKWQFNHGYGIIRQSACYAKGGLSTHCKINSRILEVSRAGRRVDLYFHATPLASRTSVRRQLIASYSPPWNAHGKGARGGSDQSTAAFRRGAPAQVKRSNQATGSRLPIGNASIDGECESTTPDWSANHMAQSKTYLRVYGLLINAAESRSTVHYSDIADLMHLPHAGNYTAKMIGRMLEEIVKRELIFGRPMLTAIVVSSVNNEPGSGFYRIAEQFGLVSANASEQERQHFWERECDSVYKEWAE
jgi:hypothetical protein